MKNKKIVIVGGGQAACQVSYSLRQQKYDGNISIFCSENYIPYQRPPLSKKFLSGEIDSDRLFLKPDKYYKNEDIDILLNSYVQEIDRKNKTIIYNDKHKMQYDSLVLATGAIPREIQTEKEDLKGLHYLRTIDDVKKIRNSIKNSKNMAVIGGGYIGLEVAAVSRAMGLNVTIVEMADRILERVTSPVVSDYFSSYHERQGVNIMTKTRVEGIEGNGSVRSVVTSSGVIKTDVVIVGIGVIPSQELAKSCGIEVSNGINVDEYCRTSDKEILSAGDCTLHPNFYYKKSIRLESVHNAIEQGKTVASTILGKKIPYDQVPWFWSDQYNLKLQIAGLISDYDDYIIRGERGDDSFAVFYLKDGKICASDCINRAAEHMVSRKIISEGISLEPEKLVDESRPIKDLLN